MAISRFQPMFDQLVLSVASLRDQLVYLRDTGDPVPYSVLDRIQEGVRAAKVFAYAALAEGQKAPAPAQAYMASINGPATFMDFQTLLAGVEAAGTAWNVKVAGFLSALTVDDLYRLVQRNDDGIGTRHLFRPYTAPQAPVDALRQSQELTDFIAALQALGI